jgi:inositol-phosphate transport system substrate-binding protein
MIHRPNAGPDYLMTFAAFGAKFMDDASGQLLLPLQPIRKGLDWYAWNAANGVTPKNNTSMTWDEIQTAFKSEQAFIFHQGVWAVGEWQIGDAKGNTWPKTAAGYFKKIGWIHAPAGAKGGQPANLSHPIVYVVNPKSKNAELAALLVAYASLPYYNTKHAATTAHTAITHGQKSMPQYENAWYLQAATPMLARSTFLPNHPDFGRYNSVLFKALQGVETGRLTPAKAIEFLEDEMTNELKNSVKVIK